MMVSDDGKRFSVPATPFWKGVSLRSAVILSKSFSVLVPVRTWHSRLGISRFLLLHLLLCRAEGCVVDQHAVQDNRHLASQRNARLFTSNFVSQFKGPRF